MKFLNKKLRALGLVTLLSLSQGCGFTASRKEARKNYFESLKTYEGKFVSKELDCKIIEGINNLNEENYPAVKNNMFMLVGYGKMQPTVGASYRSAALNAMNEALKKGIKVDKDKSLIDEKLYDSYLLMSENGGHCNKKYVSHILLKIPLENLAKDKRKELKQNFP